MNPSRQPILAALMSLLLLALIVVGSASARPSHRPGDIYPRCDLLAEIQYIGSKIYTGRLTPRDFGSVQGDTGRLSRNLGFDKGRSGLNTWIETTKQTLLHPGHDGAYWTSAKNVIIKNHEERPNAEYSFLSSDAKVAFDFEGGKRLNDRTVQWIVNQLDSDARYPSGAVKWDRTHC